MHIQLGRVAHFSLAVPDPKKSAAWWQSIFDLEVIPRNDDRMRLGNDAVLIVLFRGRPDATVLGHLAFHAGDLAKLEAARDILREKGVALEDPGDEIGPVAPGSSSLGLWFRDPDGYRWELYVPAPDLADEG